MDLPPEIVTYIADTSKHVGQTTEFMEQTNEHLSAMRDSLKKKASKEDLKSIEDMTQQHQTILTDPDASIPCVTKVIGKHVEECHPSQEEEVGRKVLGFIGWMGKNRGKSGIVGALLTILGLYFGMNFG